jgi:hypothetical protein
MCSSAASALSDRMRPALGAQLNGAAVGKVAAVRQGEGEISWWEGGVEQGIETNGFIYIINKLDKDTLNLYTAPRAYG